MVELSETPLEGVEQKRREGKQRFQKAEQAGSRDGCLKKAAAGTS